ncbi:MADS-box transcription factor 2 [Acorus calamus]|uniref:MADS-box transcription factor 2 n=1 Tax=Acorus calamus TaxID=4465 RepID=A0AAV9CTJ2_ACOCL|nr:MADS-box transcription factor 2 [Acorus calamus]
MGRGKIEIKRIENSANRQVTFSKRRAGIMKKAKEISVLCEAKVSLLVFSSSGKLYEFCSPATSLPQILEKYHQHSGQKLWDAKHEKLSAEIDRIRKENDNMQMELRHLKGEDLTSLQPVELGVIEDCLQRGIEAIQPKKWEYLKKLKVKNKSLEEKNESLSFVLQQQLTINGNVREMENGYHEKEREYPSQISLGFRVQPFQPNLQETLQ